MRRLVLVTHASCAWSRGSPGTPAARCGDTDHPPSSGGSTPGTPGGGAEGAATRARLERMEAQLHASQERVHSLERLLAEANAAANEARKVPTD
eukprot:1714035-Pyramimonas_sp.AAC.1